MDMILNVKVSKAAAVHTETTWAQAYNAGKLYIALSISTSEKGIATLGKETLERLQREFFALDVKDLETIKKAVETVTSTLPEETHYSIVLATSVDETLYIVTAGKGAVVLYRNNTSHIIAEGEENIVVGFSGIVRSGDSVGLLTEDFLITVPFSKITQAMSHDPEETAENLAPSLIENATGAEAALIITFPKHQEAAHGTDAEETLQEEEEVTEKQNTNIASGFLKKIHVPKINIRNFKSMGRKKMAIIATVFLVVILAGGIFFENMNRTNNERNARLESILKTQELAFEDATAILSLNRSLAVEELTAIKSDVEKEMETFPENSEQYKKLQEFLGKVNAIIGGGGGTAAEPTLLFEENPISHITFKGGSLIGAGEDTLNVISTEGTLEDDYDVGTEGIVSANEDNVYILSGRTITRVNKSNGQDAEIIEGLTGIKSFDVFGNNVYALTDTILRFRANNFDEENYLTEGVTLSKPTSMSIDSSVWVLDDGKIRKFTRGAEDAFSQSTELPLSNAAIIYTDEEYDNLYILDSQKKFIAIIDKEGTSVKNLELTKVPNASSFAVNEPENKIYVVSESKIYSIDF